jgi:uncharacterized protein YqjF (DUF2071 family)
MLPFLKNHPFAVEAFFETSLVLTFAVPKEELENLIPECLELDTHLDKWGFIAVALVQTKGLRPKGFPAILGNDFFLIGYRIFVKYINNAGKRLRGLYIIKSQTNKKKMEFMGNIFTHYNYSTTDIKYKKEDDKVAITSSNSGFRIVVEVPQSPEEVALPQNSPFADWKEARRFAGPLPFTFTYIAPKNKVVIIEGVRENWKPSPVKVIQAHISFLETLKLSKMILANAFIIQNIPYYWKRGKVEKWKI